MLRISQFSSTQTFLAALLVVGSLSLPSLISAQAAPPSSTRKIHSRLFEKLARPDNLRNLPGARNRTITIIDEEPPRRDSLLIDAYLKGIALRSDAVLIGTVDNSVSYLTEDERFVFTEHSIKVEEVLKDSNPAQLTPGSDVLVVSPGGSVDVGGRIVRIRLREFRDFRKGARYLLFLSRVPGGDTYQAFHDRTFELRGTKFFKMTPTQLWDERTFTTEDAASFLAEVRRAL
jgi:hypothetical protein